MRSVSDELADAIMAAGGELRFDEYLAIALYGESGFYTTTGRAGRRGDFLTSPEVGPLFGAVMARWLDTEWQRLGTPDRFLVIDLGAGPGTLARSIYAASPDCLPAIDYVAVEISAAQRQHHPSGIRSLDTLPNDVGEGVVVANELVDNLPFRLAVFDGGWREAYVALQGGRVVEVLRPWPEPVPTQFPAAPPHGARLPWHDLAQGLLLQAFQRLERGRLMVIDYAVATTAHLALRPWREWLRTYRGHERGRHYLADPGEQDITTEVAIDQLALTLGPPSALRSQAQWLQRWGLDNLVEEGRRYWNDHAARPDLTALQMRSRVSEAEALSDPRGLGDFVVIEWEVDSQTSSPHDAASI